MTLTNPSLLLHDALAGQSLPSESRPFSDASGRLASGIMPSSKHTLHATDQRVASALQAAHASPDARFAKHTRRDDEPPQADRTRRARLPLPV